MNEHILALVEIVRVFLNAEASEAKLVKVDLQRPVRGNEYVDPKVEFAATDEQRILEVLRDYV